MGRRADISEEDHKKAYQVWLRTRNMAEVARACGVTHTTVYEWRSGTFRCQFNCVYHNWDKFEAEKKAAQNARLELLEKGVHDPVEHEIAMRQAITTAKTDGKSVYKDGPAMAALRADDERLAQWEFIWAKLFFQATGVPVDPALLHDPEQMAKIDEVYGKGLKSKNLDDAIKSLATVQDQIDKLSGAARKRADEAEKTKNPTLPLLTAAKIEELRALKQAQTEKVEVGDGDAATNS